MPDVESLETRPVLAIGLLLFLVGSAATTGSQGAMGPSWRIGVDADENTELVTRGIFASVRNPIFTAMLVTAVGLFLVVPNVVSGIGLVALWVALELQVRKVEEPYLLRKHGSRYVDYAAAVGRFVPLIGRLSREESVTSA